MKTYTVDCYYDYGDVMENFKHDILADSKTEAIAAMEQMFPNADNYKIIK